MALVEITNTPLIRNGSESGVVHVLRASTPLGHFVTYATWEPGTYIDWFPVEVEPAEDLSFLFGQEKGAFTAMLPLLMERYAGQYVAVHDARVVDADISRIALVRRFFEQFGDTHVYFGFVGKEPSAYQLSPLKA